MLKIKQIIPGVLVPFSFAVGSSVEAATVVNLDDNGNVESISDLEICISSDEICEKSREELEENEIKIIDSYNVNFPLGSFNVVFGNPPDISCNLAESNQLCFWEDENQAHLPLTEINRVINDLTSTPSLIAGERFDFPDFLPNTNNFYRIPLRFNGTNQIEYHQGTYNPNNGDPNDPGPWIIDTIDSNSRTSAQSYVGFEFIGRETITPIPTTRVPEPSSLMGIFFISGSLLMVIKNKN